MHARLADGKDARAAEDEIDAALRVRPDVRESIQRMSVCIHCRKALPIEPKDHKCDDVVSEKVA